MADGAEMVYRAVSGTVAPYIGIQSRPASRACTEVDSRVDARVGGDEFSVVLPAIKSPHGFQEVAEKLVTILSKPFKIAVSEVTVTGSIGVAVYPRDGED